MADTYWRCTNGVAFKMLLVVLMFTYMFTFGGTDVHIDIYQDKSVPNTLLLRLLQHADFLFFLRGRIQLKLPCSIWKATKINVESLTAVKPISGVPAEEKLVSLNNYIVLCLLHISPQFDQRWKNI